VPDAALACSQAGRPGARGRELLKACAASARQVAALLRRCRAGEAAAAEQAAAAEALRARLAGARAPGASWSRACAGVGCPS
jgi:hypothetical protein